MEELNAIYERMRAIFAEEAGFVPNNGCDAMVRLYALASEVQSLLAQADWVLDQSFPQTAVGQYLDYHAEMRALTRLPAAKATGVLRFSAPSAAVTDYEIDAGSVAMTSGGVRFETTEKATLAKGETYVDVPASAVEAGASGNAIAGAIHLMSVYPVGITQCTNPEAFSGGSDEESDEKLRERVLESYKRLPNGANAAFYEQEAMSFPNVAAAKAVGRARGIGTVDVYVSTHAGAVLDEADGAMEYAEQEGLLQTAEGEGLARREKLFSRCPVSVSTALRREAIAALARINADSFTLDAINSTLSGCGIKALAEETEKKGTVKVWFPNTVGVPDEFSQVESIILDIIPCHLLVEFYFRYLTWLECERVGFTWQSVEDTHHTWESFEKAVPEEE